MGSPPWNAIELQDLLELVKKDNRNDKAKWNEVAYGMEERAAARGDPPWRKYNGAMCKIRYQHTDWANPNEPEFGTKWKLEEEETLLELFQKEEKGQYHGKWSRVAAEMTRRLNKGENSRKYTPNRCRDHYWKLKKAGRTEGTMRSMTGDMRVERDVSQAKPLTYVISEDEKEDEEMEEEYEVYVEEMYDEDGDEDYAVRELKVIQKWTGGGDYVEMDDGPEYLEVVTPPPKAP